MSDQNVGSEDQAPRLQNGQLLCNRYEIIEFLGQGGMGAVYKAKDRELVRGGRDELIAIKVILPEFSDRSDFVGRFKDEILLTRHVNHKSVVRTFDLQRDGPTTFLVMEFVQGEDLHAVLKARGCFPPREAAGIISQAASGIQAVHEANVIHRDLKPHNILLESTGRVVMMDFGLARLLERNGLTMSQHILGTPAYMAPEVLSGQSDARSDIYSLGVTFYELMTGALPPRPYPSQTNGTKSQVSQVMARPIPPGLDHILKKCLATDPQARYQSAADLYTALEAWLHPRRKFLGVPLNLLAAAAVIGVLVVTALWLRAFVPKPPPPPHPPVSLLFADFDNRTGDPVFSSPTLENVLRISLESASFVTVYPRDQAYKTAHQLNRAGRLDEPVADGIAIREGVQDIVAGVLARRGSGYELSVRITPAGNSKPLVSRRITAKNKADVLNNVDKLGAYLRKALGDSRAAGRPAETFTAASLDAMHAYAVAQDCALRAHKEQALAEYRRAIQFDPNLGRAYAGIAVLYRNGHQIGEALKWFKQALEHSDRMTDREKYRTRGAYYVTEGNTDEAIEEFTTLTNQFPADNAGLANLALAWCMKREFEKALQYGKQAIEVYPKNVGQLNNVAFYLMYAERFTEAIQEADKALELNHGYAKSYVVKALSELALGDTAKARDNYEQLVKLAKSSPDAGSVASLGLADVDMYEGQHQNALKTLEESLGSIAATHSSSPLLAPTLVALAECYLRVGNRTRALEIADEAVAADQGGATLFPMARVYQSAGYIDKARQLADILRKSPSNDNKAYAHLIEGEISLDRGDTQGAIYDFDDARKDADTWFGRYDHGRAHIAIGQFAEADSDFENCDHRRGEAGTVFMDDMPTYRYFAELYYYHARAEEGMRTSAAPELFKKFLSMRGAGSRDPLALDAQRRLKALSATQQTPVQQQGR